MPCSRNHKTSRRRASATRRSTTNKGRQPASPLQALVRHRSRQSMWLYYSWQSIFHSYGSDCSDSLVLRNL